MYCLRLAFKWTHKESKQFLKCGRLQITKKYKCSSYWSTTTEGSFRILAVSKRQFANWSWPRTLLGPKKQTTLLASSKSSCPKTVFTYPARHAKSVIDTDASDNGFGAVISQIDSNGIEQPIAFASRTLSERETKWTIMERECLAIVWAITDQFQCYVYGSTFTVRNDNKPLKWLQTLRKSTTRIARWILKLNEYDYEIVHRGGSANRVADALSRIPTNAVCLQNDKSIIELRDKQRSDPDLMPVIECLTSGE